MAVIIENKLKKLETLKGQLNAIENELIDDLTIEEIHDLSDALATASAYIIQVKQKYKSMLKDPK